MSAPLVFVSGASRGIGFAVASHLLARGCTVAAGYRVGADGVERLRALARDRDAVLAVQLDVRDRGSVRAAVEQIADRYGALDGVVNNAGVNRPASFDAVTEEDWCEIVDVNLNGVYRVMQELSPLLKSGSAVVNIASVSGQYGGPRSGHYAASKAALLALTHNLAIHLAPRGIRVNAVSPGLIESEMAAAADALDIDSRILLGRRGAAAEVAACVAFLLSDDASYITGHTLNVNGGLLLA
ncbi:MAG TPA: SDR family NAD(P)-dependent oxidoreductase [Solirubrobacteraceae bacterium]|jgi:3-oxoacyl-[acyl-carrier protein] reductase|nr:SDR family NAD(P)-dependent oxidoreductase [Solirubrobacteraceae bacterium]